MTRTAFVDESGSLENRDPGTYILAAAICDEQHLDTVREVMHGLRRTKVGKVHWHEESEPRRLQLAAAVAELALERLVVVRSVDSTERSSGGAGRRWNGFCTSSRCATWRSS